MSLSVVAYDLNIAILTCPSEIHNDSDVTLETNNPINMVKCSIRKPNNCARSVQQLRHVWNNLELLDA